MQGTWNVCVHCMAEKINRMEREQLVFALYVNIIVIFVVLYHFTSQIL